MGAVPKNKVTGRERRKRRAGNTPALKKNTKQAKVAKHKKGLVAQILQSVGLK